MIDVRVGHAAFRFLHHLDEVFDFVIFRRKANVALRADTIDNRLPVRIQDYEPRDSSRTGAVTFKQLLPVIHAVHVDLQLYEIAGNDGGNVGTGKPAIEVPAPAAPGCSEM